MRAARAAVRRERGATLWAAAAAGFLAASLAGSAAAQSLDALINTAEAAVLVGDANASEASPPSDPYAPPGAPQPPALRDQTPSRDGALSHGAPRTPRAPGAPALGGDAAAAAPQQRRSAPRVAAPTQLGPNIVTVAASDNIVQAAAMVGRSIVVESRHPFVEVSIANPNIAEIAPLSPRSIYILGKQVGRTNLTVFNAEGEVDAVVNLVVEPDLTELKQRLRELLPAEPIEVRTAAGGVVLSGVISSSANVSKALELAERYAPQNVSNMMAVAEAQQVMLQVRFAEVRRSAAKRLGINLAAADLGGATQFAVLSNPSVALNPIAAFSQTAGGVLIEALIEAMEEKGQLRTLAEPNLVALSGDTASFLAGGEFPIPVDEGGDDGITIEFKTFGISLGFTPTVVADRLINLELATEVSAIDPTLELNEVPGLVVRRADTTVELEEGQSFAIAGLLQEDFRNRAEQLPWIGDVPILGALFRSVDFEREQTELVIIVTPRLVTPVESERLLLPTDRINIPNEARLFLYGSVEGEVAPDVTPGVGFDSVYGYFLE